MSFEDAYNNGISKKLISVRDPEKFLDKEMAKSKHRLLQLNSSAKKMSKHFKAVIEELASIYPLNLKDPNLKDSHTRIARAWIELFSGLGVTSGDVMGTSFPAGKYDQIIMLKNIEYVSLCSHHFMVFSGKAHIGYIPNTFSGQVCGVSKLARLVDIYSRRPQLQERLCQDIMMALKKEVQPVGAMVIIEGKHGCMGCRGIKKPSASMVTSAVDGEFRESIDAKNEFLKLLDI